MPEKRSVHQFMTVAGLECIQTIEVCGCFHETYYNTDGDIELIRLQICTQCFDHAGAVLDALDKQQLLQLQLPLT